MTFLEWYGLVIAPLAISAVVLVAYGIARRDQILTLRRIELLKQRQG